MGLNAHEKHSCDAEGEVWLTLVELRGPCVELSNYAGGKLCKLRSRVVSLTSLRLCPKSGERGTMMLRLTQDDARVIG